MFQLKPTLGGFNAKLAEAYLLPPTVKPKKKKKPAPPAETELDKQADALAYASMQEKLAEFNQRLAARDLGGGWNPYDQIIHS
jgi:hypothetical protein